MFLVISSSFIVSILDEKQIIPRFPAIGVLEHGLLGTLIYTVCIVKYLQYLAEVI